MTRDPSQDTGHTLHVCSQPVIWSCSVQCVRLERHGPWPKATECPIPPSACGAQAGGPPTQGPRGHPTHSSRAHRCQLAALRVNHKPLPASSCQGLWATQECTAAPPALEPSLLKHTSPRVLIRSFSVPTGSTLDSRPARPWYKGDWGNPTSPPN